MNKVAFTYTGDMFFGNGADTIASWLGAGPGTVDGLDAVVGALTLSMPNIYAGTATTSFFLFEGEGYLGPADFSILHDGGIAV